MFSEEEIVEHILKYVSKPVFGERLGVGDDARDILVHAQRILFSIDGYSLESAMLPWRSLSDVGWCLVSSIVSDIVSKGGFPYGLMLSIGVPRDWGLDVIDELYSGVLDACREYRCRLLGGDTNLSDKPWASIACIGFTSSAYPPSRSGARPGDTVIATGLYGCMGVVVFDGVEEASRLEWVVDCTRRPTVLTRLAYIISSYSKTIHASMDVSDGLGYTLYTIARSSKVSIVIDNLPKHHSSLREYCRDDIECIVKRVFNGGEEYGVVLVVDSNRVDDLVKDLELYDIPYSIIGKVSREKHEPPYIIAWHKPLEIYRWDQLSGWTKIQGNS